MKYIHWPLLLSGALVAGTASATDRAIALQPVVAMSWEYVTPGTQVVPRKTLGVGFWQRASGAKPGVGANYVTSMEYQLPEAMPSSIRSATFQFSGKQSQCSGAEPVVIDVYAYAGDGRGDVADSTAGTRVAQMRADCATNPAFTQPVDVTAIVRQLSVPSGIRHVGFNIRKANNRQGPGLFGLHAGTLTIVVADPSVAAAPSMPRAVPVPSPAPLPVTPPAATALVLAESFEAPASGNYTVVRAGQSFTTRSATWIVESGSIDIVNTRVRTETAALDGTQAIDLAGTPGPGVLATRIATTAGQHYALTFHYSRNNGIGAVPARAQVEVVGMSPLLRGQVQHDAARWPFNAYQVWRGTFQADGPSATLRFTSLNGGNYGVMLDAVSVAALEPSAAAPPPPSPATADAGPNGLIKALNTLARGGGTKAARDQAKLEAADGLANLPAAPAGTTAMPAPTNQP
ncbi:MAG TPA: hypothetical protein VML58_17455 [Burkholderiaceae bacterium]|nr:hypothetical protein [Burkholderiaceae bacterium]